MKKYIVLNENVFTTIAYISKLLQDTSQFKLYNKRCLLIFQSTKMNGKSQTYPLVFQKENAACKHRLLFSSPYFQNHFKHLMVQFLQHPNTNSRRKSPPTKNFVYLTFSDFPNSNSQRCNLQVFQMRVFLRQTHGLTFSRVLLLPSRLFLLCLLLLLFI